MSHKKLRRSNPATASWNNSSSNVAVAQEQLTAAGAPVFCDVVVCAGVF